MLQKKSEIEHRKVPLPCGLVVASAIKRILSGTPVNLMMTGNRIVSGDQDTTGIFPLRNILTVPVVAVSSRNGEIVNPEVSDERIPFDIKREKMSIRLFSF
jgi:hypothetical protein